VAIFIAVCFVVFTVVSAVVWGWVVIAEIRRNGLGNTLRAGSREFVQDLPLYWRVPIVGWLFAIGIPLVVLWTLLQGKWDTVGAVFVGLVWLLFVALLRRHYRTKARREASRRLPSVRRHS
jgi:hypothetical protein